MSGLEAPPFSLYYRKLFVEVILARVERPNLRHPPTELPKSPFNVRFKI
jgi:hypothetical protein